MQQGDKVRIVVTWDTGGLFGVLKGEKEYEIGRTPVGGGDFLSALFGGSDQTAQAAARPVDVHSEADIRRGREAAQGALLDLAVGLEPYFVDNNRYPDDLKSLTTPVAYLSALRADPFAREASPIRYVPKGKDWLLYSIGPDQSDDKGGIQYDPTNGAVSRGDIVRRKQ